MEPGPTSPFVIATVTVAAVAIIYAYICQIRQESAARRMRAWVRETHPEAWNDLNWIHRNAIGGTIGLKRLQGGALGDDEAFAERYAKLTRLDRHKLVGIGIGVIGIGLAVVGTLYWGWSW